jgi:hypothetical protein
MQARSVLNKGFVGWGVSSRVVALVKSDLGVDTAIALPFLVRSR